MLNLDIKYVIIKIKQSDRLQKIHQHKVVEGLYNKYDKESNREAQYNID